MASRPELTTVREFQQPTRGDGGPPKDESMEARVAKLEATLPTLSTKTDVAELRGDIKTGFAETTGKIAESKISMIQWFLGVALASIGIAVAMLNYFKPAPVAPASQPIVIQIPAATTTPIPAQAPTAPTK